MVRGCHYVHNKKEEGGHNRVILLRHQKQHLSAYHIGKDKAMFPKGKLFLSHSTTFKQKIGQNLSATQIISSHGRKERKSEKKKRKVTLFQAYCPPIKPLGQTICRGFVSSSTFQDKPLRWVYLTKYFRLSPDPQLGCNIHHLLSIQGAEICAFYSLASAKY